MKEERLNSLAWTRVQSDKEVPSDKIIDDFAKMKARRLKVALNFRKKRLQSRRIKVQWTEGKSQIFADFAI